MYTNKCIKCGKEFETKNPKRVICPDCLYPDKAQGAAAPEGQNVTDDKPQEALRSYSFGNDTPQQASSERRYNNNYNRRPYNNNYNNGGGYNNRGGNYQRQERRPYNSYNNNYNNNGGNYNNNYNNGGGYQRRNDGERPARPYNSYNNNSGGYQRRPSGGFNRGGFNKKRPAPRPKALLVNKEQLAQIEEMYKKMLPLPNPDAHEVIAQAIGLEPKKVFFGINLVRQKLMLPKIPMPKRKLALTPDQLMAIKNLYEPLLPLPPIGCHKILAAQLKIDEWRVHVGIGLVRKQMGLDRWNEDREDAPEEYKKKAEEQKVEEKAE